MTKFSDYKNRQMLDPAFKAAYEELDTEFELIEALIVARKASGMTQKDLAEQTGIHQADISRIENGNANPSLLTLRRLAAGLGMKLHISLDPLSGE